MIKTPLPKTYDFHTTEERSTSGGRKVAISSPLMTQINQGSILQSRLL